MALPSDPYSPLHSPTASNLSANAARPVAAPPQTPPSRLAQAAPSPGIGFSGRATPPAFAWAASSHRRNGCHTRPTHQARDRIERPCSPCTKRMASSCPSAPNGLLPPAMTRAVRPPNASARQRRRCAQSEVPLLPPARGRVRRRTRSPAFPAGKPPAPPPGIRPLESLMVSRRAAPQQGNSPGWPPRTISFPRTSRCRPALPPPYPPRMLRPVNQAPAVLPAVVLPRTAEYIRPLPPAANKGASTRATTCPGSSLPPVVESPSWHPGHSRI
jgi:hypothetical protein